MRKKLLSLALVLALALSLAPAAFAAGQFADVPDTSPFAAPIAWAVEKQITNGVTPTTFGPGNTCTTSHILTFLWRANGRPGDAGDEKAAVTAWATGLGIDTSDLNAPCTRANAVTYMWKAAGSPEPTQTASFADVAADAPYASAPFKVEGPNEKGTYYLRVSDGGLHPYIKYKEGEGLSTSEYGLGTPAVSFDYDAKSVDARAEALFGSSATVFDMFDDYAGILKTCGFTEKSAKSISGDPITVYEKEGYSVQLLNPSFNHQTHGYWQSPCYTVTIYFPKR